MHIHVCRGNAHTRYKQMNLYVFKQLTSNINFHERPQPPFEVRMHQAGKKDSADPFSTQAAPTDVRPRLRYTVSKAPVPVQGLKLARGSLCSLCPRTIQEGQQVRQPLPRPCTRSCIQVQCKQATGDPGQASRRRSHPGGPRGKARGGSEVAPDPHPLALLGVGHAPALQHQMQVVRGGVAARGQPLEPTDGGEPGQGPQLGLQQLLQHLSLRGGQEGLWGRQGCVHGGRSRPRPGQGLAPAAPQVRQAAEGGARGGHEVGVRRERRGPWAKAFPGHTSHLAVGGRVPAGAEPWVGGACGGPGRAGGGRRGRTLRLGSTGFTPVAPP